MWFALRFMSTLTYRFFRLNGIIAYFATPAKGAWSPSMGSFFEPRSRCHFGRVGSPTSSEDQDCGMKLRYVLKQGGLLDLMVHFRAEPGQTLRFLFSAEKYFG